MIKKQVAVSPQSLKKEFLRKIIHISIAFLPVIAGWNYIFAVVLLSSGILFYTLNEAARVNGRKTIISMVTNLASRPYETGFVFGPVTLGLGALTALLYYPDPAATVAIYALAFGDGFASLAGKFFNRKTIPAVREKTLAGSFACFTAVLISSNFVLGNFQIALIAALTATILELLPSGDFDNIIIPVGTGMIINLLT